MYDSGIARWMSMDPVGFVDDDYRPIDANRYQYAESRPVLYVDPSGLQAILFGCESVVPRPFLETCGRPNLGIYEPPPLPSPSPLPPTIGTPPTLPVQTSPSPNPGPKPEPWPKPGPNPPGENMRRPGDCSPEQYEKLRAAIYRHCKGNDPPKKCSGFLARNFRGCDFFEDMANRWDDCLSARRRLDQACFKGGNTTHQDEEAKAAINRDWCWYYYRRHGCQSWWEQRHPCA